MWEDGPFALTIIATPPRNQVWSLLSATIPDVTETPEMSKTKPRKNDKKDVCCPVETTLAAIGGRWKVLIIHHLIDGSKRFGQLTKLLRGVSARTLTRQLRELEDSGIVSRFVHQQIPPKVEYSLTAMGGELKPILFAMHAWGEQWERQQAKKSPR